jgi:hypothetical protein
MTTVAEFIDSIAQLSVDSKAELKSHVQKVEFGASLDADWDELMEDALRDNLPTTFNILQRTAVVRALKHPGQQL